jgi:NAD(P)-dependent dehydrogenase (short-subunit alcohol dehydrogenase family)
MRVVINGRDAERTQSVSDELAALGAETLPIAADVGSSADAASLFDQVMRAWGRVDLLVNNAADLRRKKFFEADEALLDAELVSNIRGPYATAIEAAEIMRAQGGGGIVHISSVGGLRPPADCHTTDQRRARCRGARPGDRAGAVQHPRQRWRPAPRSPQHQAACRRSLEMDPRRAVRHAARMGAAVAFLASEDASYIIARSFTWTAGSRCNWAPEQPL